MTVVIGCHAVTDSINDYQMCNGDVACKAQMIEYGNVTVSAVKASGLSSSLVEFIAFNIASGLSGILLGLKLRKKRG